MTQLLTRLTCSKSAAMNINSTQEEYGRRLMPKALDVIAKNQPRRVFAAIPRTDNLAQGFVDITFQQVANAINSLAFRLRDRFGNSHKGQETVTYFGVPDIRYTIVFFASVKCGYKVCQETSRTYGMVHEVNRYFYLLRETLLPSTSV